MSNSLSALKQLRRVEFLYDACLYSLYRFDAKPEVMLGLAGNMGSSPLIGKAEAASFSAAVGVIVYPMLPKRAVPVELMTHAVARPPRRDGAGPDDRTCRMRPGRAPRVRAPLPPP